MILFFINTMISTSKIKATINAKILTTKDAELRSWKGSVTSESITNNIARDNQVFKAPLLSIYYQLIILYFLVYR